MKFIAALLAGLQLSLAQFVPDRTVLPLDTVATVGNRIITGKDFVERFELMPWLHKEQAGRIEETKKEFLYSLIAEKLLAIEAAAKNIGTDSASINMQYDLERVFVRDELYKREVLPKITISNRELADGIQRFARDADIEVIGVLSKKEGDLLYSKVSRSRDKNSVLEMFRDSLYTPLDTIHVTYGETEESFEDMVYAIGKDSLSPPFQLQGSTWVMARLLHRYPNPKYVELSRPDQLMKVEKIIRERKEDSIAVKTFASITGNQRAEADPKYFFMLADTMGAMLAADSAAYRMKNVYHLPPSVVSKLMTTFEPFLADTFVTINGGAPMTFRQVLIGLGDNNIVFPNLALQTVRWIVNNNIKTVIQNELLSRTGLKRNLQQSENVRHDISTWMDNRRSALLAHRILDTVSVTDADIESEYQKNPKAYGATVMVNLQEILVDSVDVAKQLKERVVNGEDMGNLAKKYSKRKEWARNGGISGFIDSGQWGLLGILAAEAKIGTVQGPWRIKEGLTIFKVLDRKVVDDSIRKNFSNIKQKIEAKLAAEKEKNVMNKYIGTLAKRYGVTINEANLHKVKTTTTNMYTWRHIGFGGRILAVPPVVPETGWIDEWRKEEQLNQ